MTLLGAMSMNVVFLTCCVVNLKEKWVCLTLLTQLVGKRYRGRDGLGAAILK